MTDQLTADQIDLILECLDRCLGYDLADGHRTAKTWQTLTNERLVKIDQIATIQEALALTMTEEFEVCGSSDEVRRLLEIAKALDGVRSTECGVRS